MAASVLAAVGSSDGISVWNRLLCSFNVAVQKSGYIVTVIAWNKSCWCTLESNLFLAWSARTFNTLLTLSFLLCLLRLRSRNFCITTRDLTPCVQILYFQFVLVRQSAISKLVLKTVKWIKSDDAKPPRGLDCSWF